MPRKLSLTTIAVLGAIEAGHRFGLAVMRETGLPSGTVYPVLGRAEEAGYIRGAWEHGDDGPADVGRPRRRYYTLTRQGERALNEAIAQVAALTGQRGLLTNE